MNRSLEHQALADPAALAPVEASTRGLPAAAHARARMPGPGPQEPLAGAARPAAKRLGPVSGAVSRRAHVLRVVDPDQPRHLLHRRPLLRGRLAVRHAAAVGRVVVGGVLAVFVLHAWLAMRKFPANFRQYKVFAAHKAQLRHGDTGLWWIQLWTGFALFFLGTVHLYGMLTQPAAIGPYESADRIWTGHPVAALPALLFMVEVHGSIGLYRLALKWGWLEGATRPPGGGACAS
jgi:succinate dehydrogenase hydrophobic anchor subunit